MVQPFKLPNFAALDKLDTNRCNVAFQQFSDNAGHRFNELGNFNTHLIGDYFVVFPDRISNQPVNLIRVNRRKSRPLDMAHQFSERTADQLCAGAVGMVWRC